MLTPEQPFRDLSQTTCIAHTNVIYSTIQNMDPCRFACHWLCIHFIKIGSCWCGSFNLNLYQKGKFIVVRVQHYSTVVCYSSVHVLRGTNTCKKVAHWKHLNTELQPSAKSMQQPKMLPWHNLTNVSMKSHPDLPNTIASRQVIGPQ